MIYELRVYEHVEGRADAVRQRFEAEVVPRFPKHGIELVGAFVDQDTNRLTYLTRFENAEASKAAWASFGADPEWKAAKAASETDGPLIARQVATTLTPAIAGLPLA
ncbi:NIPSNAP family protein [Arsenicitalea aurantiaca]|uniref:NIPSNAP family protein n=1 Tax=Arsenicitalea aurantiaca TaxID=1783274 RepID=A0A433XKQ3_9HYPH|nr:NIPSNAP family protein [Arsenicitalea aurantiaca]RUT34670.1 NIPSNAP family protein [Arsenicitalea aurantiaca]